MRMLRDLGADSKCWYWMRLAEGCPSDRELRSPTASAAGVRRVNDGKNRIAVRVFAFHVIFLCRANWRQ